ncbi:MAG: hypothetical protein IPG15_04410 [Arcobacter sp.]|jgi:hypothetical protein|uniref:hypothetical protein n=1 Tax=Aliarcobacter cryaerophilus TaxID=28198 RepID=UPI0013FD4B1C|nr:hypothetical protein [Aliarcobacter cryaerophilus]MBK6303131.1 hypothetical protein [Arcobacter sp.]MBP6289248.1 hypothetical protein [Aliarcobacter sp.]MBK6547704.1 hypothetical protein [Arcobacter sp.]MBP7250960.1 hypothetical protein [Aliarcobacter sp.]QNM88532.1 hypothetical protein HOO41_02165 [Aliarcobacter cryaerophilus]
MDNYIKGLIVIIVVLFIAVYVLFNIILGNDTKDKKKINENPSSIQERRDALKKMFN